MKNYDLVIIGGGPAGLSSAIAAKENGVNDILILERDVRLGGILNQCIHNGFGLHRFKEELAGPEYAGRDIKTVKELGIDVMLDTCLLYTSNCNVFMVWIFTIKHFFKHIKIAIHIFFYFASLS